MYFQDICYIREDMAGAMAAQFFSHEQHASKSWPSQHIETLPDKYSKDPEDQDVLRHNDDHLFVTAVASAT